MFKYKSIVNFILIFTVVLCGSFSAFAETEFIDYSEWDSPFSHREWDNATTYPIDVMNTQLILPVSYLIDREILTGDADGLFHPNRNINRAEFANMIAKATNSLTEIEDMRNMEIFSDLAGYDWAKGAVNAVALAGIFNGRGNNRFAPGENITYAEVMTALIRMRPGAADTAAAMSSRWPDNYILYAETYNMVRNVQIYDWNAPATRGDAAWLLFTVLPKETDDWASVRALTVNSISATLRGGSFTARIGVSPNATIMFDSNRNGDRIFFRDAETNTLLASGTGRLTYTVSGIVTPYKLRISVLSGTATTTYTLDIIQ